MTNTEQPADPTVRALVDTINAGDRDAFFALLSPDATLSDDGTERDLTAWVDREIFGANGQLEVVSQSADGRSLVADYRNDTYGQMRTARSFTVADGTVSHIEAGQA